MTDYRWNEIDNARGYDEAAEQVHPYYQEIQQVILDHMRRVMGAGLVPERLHSALHGWIARNVDRFGTPRISGEDCHETAEAQLGYLKSAGLSDSHVVWQQDMWSVLSARKPQVGSRTGERET